MLRAMCSSSSMRDVIVPRTLLEAIHATMSDPNCIGGGVDVDYRPRHGWVRLYLGAWRFLGNLTGWCRAPCSSVARVSSNRSEATTRGVDRRGRRLLLEPPTAGQEKPSHGPAHSRAARATLVPTLRQVAAVEDPALDKPPLHPALPALETGLEGLVLGSCAIGRWQRRFGIRVSCCLAYLALRQEACYPRSCRSARERRDDNDLVELRAAGGRSRVPRGLRHDRQPVHATRHHRVRPAGSRSHRRRRGVGRTPTDVRLIRSDSDAALRLQKDGFAPRVVRPRRSLSRWLIGNLVLPAVLSYALSPAAQVSGLIYGYTFAGTAGLAFATDLFVTGAGFTFPDTVRTTLAPAAGMSAHPRQQQSRHKAGSRFPPARRRQRASRRTSVAGTSTGSPMTAGPALPTSRRTPGCASSLAAAREP